MFTSHMNPVREAVAIIGSQAGLARVCNQPPQAVTRWLKSGKVPARHAPVIEKAVGGKVSRSRLCPGFPWDEEPSAARTDRRSKLKAAA